MIPKVLTGLVRSALDASAGGEAVPVEPVVATRDSAHGDYQSNAAFRVARALGSRPRAVADRIVSALSRHPAIALVEVAGPGFVNFRLSEAWLGELLAAMCADPHLGVPQRGGTVVLDYSSPNVAKRMHVAHIRSTVIGNALDRLHRAAGYRVIADNHLGDWGTQFGRLITAWRLWLDQDAFDRDPLGELQRLYVLFARRSPDDPSLDRQARLETAKLQAGDPENRRLWRRFIDVSLAEFDALYRRLGVHFDVTCGESFYQGELGALVDGLLERGIAVESEGAVVIPFGPAEGLSETPLLVRKRDGAALYGTTDLAAIRHRLRTWRPDRIVYVTDARQKLHFRQLFAAARRIGWDRVELVHVPFGLLTLPSGTMSSRKGNVVHLADVLDESVRRARAVVDQKSPELPGPARDRIAEAVGVGAVKYADLSQNPQSDVVFDWERMLSLDGNTAPFLMYSHARCRSLQAKGGIERSEVGGDAPTPGPERALVLSLLRFPEAVEAALSHYRPNLLCDHLFGLASDFNRFYNQLPVLRAGARDRERRLGLVEATARVLRAGLELLGLEALDRM